MLKTMSNDPYIHIAVNHFHISYHSQIDDSITKELNQTQLRIVIIT